MVVSIRLIIIIIIFLGLYFTPSFIAHFRKHPNLVGIFVLNLLLGWTLIGWIIALIWSLLARSEEIQGYENNDTVTQQPTVDSTYIPGTIIQNPSNYGQTQGTSIVEDKEDSDQEITFANYHKLLKESENTNPNISPEEFSKLRDLVDKGLLSKEEFEKMKTKKSN